ncbi:hypothetical protein Bca4012_084535 [Brassica carinata]
MSTTFVSQGQAGVASERSISDSLNQLTSKESVSVTRAALLRCAKRLRKKSKNQQALEVCPRSSSGLLI